MLTYKDIEVRVNGTKITDYISFIWTDRYNSCGDFELEVPFTEKNNEFYEADQIVTCNLSKNKMIIETIKISISAENGERMLLTGRDYSSVLDRRVVAFTQIYDNNFFNDNKFINAFKEIFRSCFGDGRMQALTTTAPNPNSKDYKNAIGYDTRRKMGMSVLAGNDRSGNIKNANINIDATGKTVLELLEEQCQAKDFGFKTDEHICTIYDGKEVKGLVFSMSKGNLISVDYSASKEKYKNAAYIQGDEYQANKNKVEVNGDYVATDQLTPGTAILLSPAQTKEDPIYYRAQINSGNASGLDRREIYINSSKNIGQNSNEKYVARLEAEGRLELLKNHRWETQASCEIVHDTNTTYGKDFELGDIITIELNASYDFIDPSDTSKKVKSIKMRVNEFTISHSDAGLDLYPTLVTYDPIKYAESNSIDSGFDPSENGSGSGTGGGLGTGGGASGYPSKYGKYSRITFDFNTGHMSEDSSGIIFTVPNEINQNNKRLIDGKYEPNEWYVLPEGLPVGIINTSEITGKFSFQQFGDFVTGPDMEPIKEHYIFQGWYDKATGRKFEDHVPGDDETGYLVQSDDITFIAKWEIESYDITFDHGEGGNFTTTYGLNESGQIVINVPWGSYPSPPGVIAEPGYRAADPQWNPEIKVVENSATYTAQWEQDDDDDDGPGQEDPEGSDYTKDDLPTDGLDDEEGPSTEKAEEKETPSLGLIHFRSLGSRIGDQYEINGNNLVRTKEKWQSYEWTYTRELNNGFKFQAHWFDPRFIKAQSGTAANEFSRVQNNRCFGISITKDDRVIGLWRWNTSITGYCGTPEIAFTTIPTYIPYYDYSTLSEGYDRGDIQYGLLHLAPIFIPFKYYKKVGDRYWMLCVPPSNWLTNWGSYYYLRKAGHYVGFTCQFYDDLGNRIDPNWVREDPNAQGKIEIKVNGKAYSANTQLSYGTYYTYLPQYGYWGASRGPNTIYPPYSSYKDSLSPYVDSVNLNGIWEQCGWLWKKIPIERWSATEVANVTSVYDAEKYSGPLAIPMNLSGESGGGDGYGHQHYSYYAPYTRSAGMIYGPGFPGYETYSIDNKSWDVSDREILENVGDATFDILFKQAGSTGLSARIVQQISNVISKSKSLSYFTYRVWLPAIARLKDITWYVSSDGQNWHVISWAHGNSVKIQTTDKTVAEQQAAGLTGADAIIGTDGSYYKSEVRYTDEDGNEFLQMSDIGQLNIDDTDITGAGIEMGDLMNPDGTVKGIDIGTDITNITDGMNFGDLTGGQILDIKNMFNSGSTADIIASSTGIPKSIVDLVIKTIKK